MSTSGPRVAEPVDPGALTAAIGYRFTDQRLLAQALAHRSWIAEHPGTQSNERLEFLGDAVLGWIVADLAYRRYPDVPEGVLTDLRKGVVNATALAEVAREIGLGAHLLLGRGEDLAGGREKPSLLSAAFEAVLGAVYLDGGPSAAHDLVERLIGGRLADPDAVLAGVDPKSALQELAAGSGLDAPRYTSTSVGPDHAKRFSATVWVGNAEAGRGSGGSRKEAEQSAAAAALARWRPRSDGVE